MNMQTISLYLYRIFWTLKILLKFAKNWKGQKQRKSFKIVFVELYRIFLLSLNCKNFPLIIFLLIGFLTSKRKSLFQNGFSLVGAAGAWQRDTSWHLVTDINFIIAAPVTITSTSTSNHPLKKYWNSDYLQYSPPQPPQYPVVSQSRYLSIFVWFKAPGFAACLICWENCLFWQVFDLRTQSPSPDSHKCRVRAASLNCRKLRQNWICYILSLLTSALFTLTHFKLVTILPI